MEVALVLVAKTSNTAIIIVLVVVVLIQLLTPKQSDRDAVPVVSANTARLASVTITVPAVTPSAAVLLVPTATTLTAVIVVITGITTALGHLALIVRHVQNLVAMLIGEITPPIVRVVPVMLRPVVQAPSLYLSVPLLLTLANHLLPLPLVYLAVMERLPGFTSGTVQLG